MYRRCVFVAPLLPIGMAVVRLVFGSDPVRGEVFGQGQSFLRAEAGATIKSVLVRVNKPGPHRVARCTSGRFMLGLYIGRSGVASACRAAGSIIVGLLWATKHRFFLIGCRVHAGYTRTFGSLRHIAAPPAAASAQTR
jgi:hypothetical protein